MIESFHKKYLDFINEDEIKIKEVNRCYEIQHIIPKYMGGSDDIDNKILLKVEDHLLLANLTKKFKF